MKKFPFLMLIIVAMLFIFSGCNSNEKNQTLINFYGEEKYNELSIICTEKDKIDVANELIETAKTVLLDTQKEYTSSMVGALERYSYYDPTITKADVKIELITTEQFSNEGYIWIRYSAQYYRDNNLISGSQDVISRWTIKQNDNQWYVTLIEEQ